MLNDRVSHVGRCYTIVSSRVLQTTISIWSHSLVIFWANNIPYWRIVDITDVSQFYTLLDEVIPPTYACRKNELLRERSGKGRSDKLTGHIAVRCFWDVNEIEMVKSVENHYFVPCSPKFDRKTLRENPLWKYQFDLSLLQGKRLTIERKRKSGKDKPLHLSKYQLKTEKQLMRPPRCKNKIKCSWSNEKVALPKRSCRRYSILPYNNTWKHCQDEVCNQMTILLVE